MIEESLSASRVLVTGASGFLGAHLCDRLCACGAEVHAVSRVERRDTDRLRWWRSDFDDLADIDRILRAVRPDVVFHFGGRVSSIGEIREVLPTFSSLAASSVYLLKQATELGCRRVVVAGTYADPLSGADVPSTPYAAAKWCASVYARMFHALYATPVVIARPFMTYGPREQERKLIPHVITSLLRGQRPRLTRGTLMADWIYVDDVIDGLLRTATSASAVGEEVDLGTGKLTSVRDVVEMIVARMQPPVTPEFGALPDRARETIRAADVERTAALIGWRAQTSLAAGLDRAIAWHRNQMNPAGAGDEASR